MLQYVKKLTALSAILALMLVTTQFVSAQAPLNKYIIVLQDNVSVNETANDLSRKYNINKSHTYQYSIKGLAGTLPESQLKLLKQDARVKFVSQDKMVSIDTHNLAPSQTLPSGVNRIDAENKTNTGNGINVAVIDTGIDLDHPDLATNIVGGKNCNSGSSYDDGNGHGSHVAGTIAAVNNSNGVVGVAPNAKLWAVRVLGNTGSGSWSQVICGIDFVTSNAPANGGPIQIANMSLGGSGTSDNNCGLTNSDALHAAICKARDAGVTFVVAAGNDGVNANTKVPASYDDAVITVSALADSDGQAGGLGSNTSYGKDDTFASFSNYGSVVDLAAPGVKIKSTWKRADYKEISGTSMASPHVAGSAALYLSLYPASNWVQIRDGLRSIGEQAGQGHYDPTGQHPEPVVKVSDL